MPRTAGPAREKLLDAAIAMVRSKGYSASSVDEICRTAGVTKGAFFHHFKGKDALAIAAAEHFAARADALFRQADFLRHADPLDRLLGYVDFRKELIHGAVPEFTCYLGTMVQDVHGSHPEIRAACAAEIDGQIAFLAGLVADAVSARKLRPGWTAQSLAQHIQAVLQGAFVLAKAENGRAAAASCLDHLHTYLRILFEGADDLEQ